MRCSHAVQRVAEALEMLADIHVDAQTDAELEEDLTALLRLSHRLDAAIASRAVRWDARGIWAGDGSRSAASRLGRQCSMSLASATAVLRRSRSLTEMAATRRAFTSGELSTDQVDVLARAGGRERGPVFERDESMLIDAAGTLSFGQFNRALCYWTQRADAEVGDDGPVPPVSTSEATIGIGLYGETRLIAHLDPIEGALVDNALDKMIAELQRDDRDAGRPARTKPQLRAAALVEIVRRAMAAPQGQPARVMLRIVCDVERFAQLCELSNGVVIAPRQIVPHLDKLDIRTIVFDTPTRSVRTSSRRTFAGVLREVIEVRDLHCQHPSGCDQSIDRCDVDHIIPMSRGGPTSLENGRLVCRFHNRIAAEGTTPPPRNQVGDQMPNERDRPPPRSA